MFSNSTTSKKPLLTAADQIFQNQQLSTDSATWQRVLFGVQILTGIFVVVSVVWFIFVTRGGAYFTKRSVSDLHLHVSLYGVLSVFFGFCSLTSYIMFATCYFKFGVYFLFCGIHCLFMILSLLLIKFRFQTRCQVIVKENREVGMLITEREAADLCRIRDYYERTKKSTNWNRPIFTKDQLEVWARYLAIADLTNEKHQALQQILNEMRRGPFVWRPSCFPPENPLPVVSNFVTPPDNVPPAYRP